MNILFVSTSIPFPARQGVELPLEHIIEKLAVSHTVDILAIVKDQQGRDDFSARRKNVPRAVRQINMVHAYSRSLPTAALRELIGLAPTFLIDQYNSEELRRIFNHYHYDMVWVSPIGCIGLLQACNRLGLQVSDYLAVGHNDAKVTLYWDGFKQVLKGRVRTDWRLILQGLRIPWIWLYERRYLRNAHFVHLQTPIECWRTRRVLGTKANDVRLFDAPNGKKVELEAANYRGSNTKRVLFMTHLAGGRRSESCWFLQKVWTRVLREIPDARLWLVGTPPDKKTETDLLKFARVKICGYVDHLVALFDSVALSVIPTLHGTGWINRIADSLTAGVPVVGCSEPLKTIPGLKIGIHALKGDTAVEFADNIVKLLSDAELRDTLSNNSRQLSFGLPTWETTVTKIEAELMAVVNPEI